MIELKDIDREKRILGTAMQGVTYYDKIVKYVKNPDFFHFGSHRIIYRTLQELVTDNKPADLVAVNRTLTEKGLIESVGGLDYILEINSLSMISNIEFEAALFGEVYTRRALAETCQAYGANANNPELDPFNLIENLVTELNDKMAVFSNSRITPFSEVVDEQIKDMHERVQIRKEMGEDYIFGLTTGLVDLDRALGGIVKDDYFIFGGRPGHGKTALSTQIAEHIGTIGKPTLFDSLEMQAGELVDRLLCAGGGVDYTRFQDGDLTPDEQIRVQNYAQRIRPLPIHIDDGFNLTVAGIRAQARKLINETKTPLELIVVDNIQIMQGKGFKRYNEITEISRNLRMLAREIAPVICISHLSRDVEKRPGSNRPMNSDLRESGAIEQDATKILFVYRPAEYGEEYCKANHKKILDMWQTRTIEPGYEDPDFMEIMRELAFAIVTKGRRRGTAIVPLKWNGNRVRFETVTDERIRELYGLPPLTERKEVFDAPF